jgi:hypothetical protein
VTTDSETSETDDLDSFITSLGPHRPWFKFGFRSPVILWKRMSSTHAWLHPIREIRFGLQRWRYGVSDRDTWSFDWYLAGVIERGCRQIRERSISHPGELKPEEWDKILIEIETGMAASRKVMNEYLLDDSPEHAQFELAMDHLKKWWYGLWD